MYVNVFIFLLPSFLWMLEGRRIEKKNRGKSISAASQYEFGCYLFPRNPPSGLRVAVRSASGVTVGP